MAEATPTDVLVVGGGAAGVAAAVAAADAGADTVLLEQHGFFGGLATSALVGTVCGLHLRAPGPPRWAHGGFPRAFGERLQATSGAGVAEWRDGLRFLPYDPLAFRQLCDDLVIAAGVRPLLHTTVTGATLGDGRITAVHALAWDRPTSFAPRAVIDATGHAALATLTGARLAPTGRHQAPAVVFSLDGLAPLDEFQLRMVLLKAVKDAVAAGVLPCDAETLSVVPGTHRGRTARFKLGLRERVAGGAEVITRLELRARALIGQVTDHLRAETAAFADTRVVDVASQLGVRTGRRPVGRETLTDEDVLNARPHPEGVANGAWPIEEWGEDARPSLSCFAEGAVYEVPAGALAAADLDHLWFAGRHLSATDGAVASARVIGTCLATGWAAGRLAARQVQGRPRAEAVAEIRTAQVTLGGPP